MRRITCRNISSPNDTYVTIDMFNLQVSENLKWNWSPVEDDELPLAVFDISADAERAYMRILLSDQQV